MNKAFEGAKRKGREARERGDPERANPYSDERTYRGSVTFSRAFLRAWQAGWRSFQHATTGMVMPRRPTRCPSPEQEEATQIIKECWGALNFILAFYEPGQRYLDTNAWKQAEASGRRAHAKARAWIDAHAPKMAISLHSVITLTRPVGCKVGVLPEGHRGTVVHVYDDGEHYEVEFAEPVCTVTLTDDDIQAQE